VYRADRNHRRGCHASETQPLLHEGSRRIARG
jgi:hypothetical protein